MTRPIVTLAGVAVRVIDADREYRIAVGRAENAMGKVMRAATDPAGA